MKFSIALTAVFLPIVVNAQYGAPPPAPASPSSSSAAASPSASNSNNVNVRCAFVIPSIFADVRPSGRRCPWRCTIVQPVGHHRGKWHHRDFHLPRVRFLFRLYICIGIHTHSARRTVAHSVTQSTFAAPCTYLAAANGSSGGFDSGLQNTAKQFTVTIENDQERKPTLPSSSLCLRSLLILTTAVWFFCKSLQHCGNGMVG